MKGLELNSNPVLILWAMQHKERGRTAGPLGHNAHVHSWKRSEMTRVKLASGWPPAQHFHFSKILSPAHVDLSHDSPLKLDFFFQVYFRSLFSPLHSSWFSLRCWCMCTHGMRNLQSFAELVEFCLFRIFLSTIRKDRK